MVDVAGKNEPISFLGAHGIERAQGKELRSSNSNRGNRSSEAPHRPRTPRSQMSSDQSRGSFTANDGDWNGESDANDSVRIRYPNRYPPAEEGGSRFSVDLRTLRARSAGIQRANGGAGADVVSTPLSGRNGDLVLCGQCVRRCPPTHARSGWRCVSRAGPVVEARSSKHDEGAGTVEILNRTSGEDKQLATVSGSPKDGADQPAARSKAQIHVTRTHSAVVADGSVAQPPHAPFVNQSRSSQLRSINLNSV